MRPIQFEPASLVKLLKKQRVATLGELKDALGTKVTVTVFRKLKALAYRTSYSHRGRYYTLDEIARFDARGLWRFRDIRFSRHGTLLSTAEAFVRASEKGFFASELEDDLGVVGVKDALATLVGRGQLAREKISGRYLYCSPESAEKRRQLLLRETQEEDLLLGATTGGTLPEELKAAIVVFYSVLDERQRRLYAAIESLKLGHGGDRKIAGLLDLDPGTVAEGRRELLRREFEVERIRREGAGRKPLEKKRRR